MPLDDGRLTETRCGNNIREGEKELLRWRTINCLQTIHNSIPWTMEICTPLSMNAFVTLAEEQHMEYHCKALI
jgi:hypothetical protein